MLFRALVVWLLFLGIAILNGGIREGWLTPRFGAATGHVLSTVMLAAFILLASWLTIGWIRAPSSSAAFQVGLMWVVLTLAFEFLGGHYLFGRAWTTLWSDYDLTRGRISLLIPVVTLLAPLLARQLRQR
jgi:phosphotransferase system  glucose/maltose/N-acetylglucosamine-specific IIC component